MTHSAQAECVGAKKLRFTFVFIGPQACLNKARAIPDCGQNIQTITSSRFRIGKFEPTQQQLASLTTIVADTGDIASIAKIQPQDATTNPSLILKASKDPAYRAFLTEAVENSVSLEDAADRVLVNFGAEILKHVKGRVSTEVDARLSFDVEKTIAKARRLIELYEEKGIDRERVLIKIAATWEGVQAARVLEKENIHCNLTLIFSVAQAEIAANAGVTLISPFVGRIYDWFKKKAGADWDEEANAGENDPGVQSVRKIFERLKGLGAKTQIMGASFRNKGQIVALAGCDLLTISPKLIEELSNSEEKFEKKLDVAKVNPIRAEPLTEAQWRFAMCEDEMASYKLDEGIRAFVKDTLTLKEILRQMRTETGKIWPQD